MLRSLFTARSRTAYPAAMPSPVGWVCALVGLLAACAGDGDDPRSGQNSVETAEAGAPEEVDAGHELDAESARDGDRVEDDDAPASEEGGEVGEGESDGEAGKADGGESLPPTASTEGKGCQSDVDCDDGIFCNGSETCAAGANAAHTCKRGAVRPCSNAHPCLEATRSCDCGTLDFDRDNFVAVECGGNDCDDERRTCNPDGTEVCDRDDRDEDCNPTTYSDRRPRGANALDGDNDRDGFVGAQCRNLNRTTGEYHHGPDCDDSTRLFSPDVREVCNHIDDNCDGLIDELNGVAGGLMVTFLPDVDGDLHADKNAQPVRACDFYEPAGYIQGNPADAKDCDDQRASVFGGARETCDGIDNDCDGAVDAQDDGLEGGPEFTGTTIACSNGSWIVPPGGCPQDTLWCPGDLITQGCARDGTRLSSCHSCQTSCQFSCGRTDCDEIVQVTSGDHHACALTREGRVACWGRGEGGRLGNDSVAQASRPNYVVGLPAAVAIAAGGHHTCAIAGADRALYCWGRNESLQLGNVDAGAFSTRPVPVWGLVGGASRLVGVAQVAAGTQHTCAVLSAGNLVCFGQADDGLLGNGNMDPIRLAPVPASRMVTLPNVPFPLPRPVTNARLVALGDSHGCILTQQGNVECWGTNTYGQLALAPDTVPNGYLTPVPGLSGVTAIVAGFSHTCAIAGGTVSCWGADDHLQLGRASTPDETENWIAKRVEGLSDVTDVAAGGQNSCAIATNGTTSCWGVNDQGQLGPEFTGAASNRPISIPGTFAHVDSGLLFGCGLRADRRLFCWGANALGQLGTDSLEQVVRSPQQVRPVNTANP